MIQLESFTEIGLVSKWILSDIPVPYMYVNRYTYWNDIALYVMTNFIH